MLAPVPTPVNSVTLLPVVSVVRSAVAVPARLSVKCDVLRFAVDVCDIWSRFLSLPSTILLHLLLWLRLTLSSFRSASSFQRWYLLLLSLSLRHVVPSHSAWFQMYLTEQHCRHCPAILCSLPRPLLSIQLRYCPLCPSSGLLLLFLPG